MQIREARIDDQGLFGDACTDYEMNCRHKIVLQQSESFAGNSYEKKYS